MNLFSGAFVRETTMFWSIKMRINRRKPKPIALRTLAPDSLSSGAI